PQGSLAARVRAHESGYPMVTGSTLNGTRTWAGWASYFIDHAAVLPGRPADVHRTPPGHCSYMRELLTAVGGFPEDMRAGEDTVVNMELTGRGYPTWRAQDVRMIHHSPCATPGVLLRHHFKRGRAHGRIILDQWAPGLPPAGELRYFAVEYLPGRVRQIGAAVRSWGSRRERVRYTLVYPLVVAGAAASWAGTWYQLLTAGRARLDEVGAAAGFAGAEPATVSRPAGPAEPRRPEERAHRGPVLEALYPHAPRHRLVAQVPPSTRRRLRRVVTAAVTHAHLVRRPGVAIVGITGSAGKTTTKDLLGEMLARFGPTLRTRHNDNGVYGVPATLLAIRPSDRFAVLELGILDGPGEMRWMARLFRPRVAVLTGIGQDHLQAYGSREAIVREKRALLARLGRHATAVVNADDAFARGATAGLPCRVITAGWAQDADVRIVDARLVWPHGLDLELDCGGRRVRGRVGLHSRELAHIPALAVAAAEACGVPPEEALDAAGAFTPRLGRLCPIPGPNGSMFLVDDFKSRLPNALLAVRALREVPATRRIAVVGELQEGALDGTGYRQIADELCATADLLVAVGGSADPLLAVLDDRASVVMSVKDARGAAEVLEGTLRDGDVVLLHGADHQDLELVTEILNGVPRDVPRPAHRTGRRALEVNAYIEPRRGDRALETAAHHLTYLSVLSHKLRPDGRLEPLRFARASAAAGTGGPARLLVISNRQGDRFSRQLATEILGSALVQDRLVANVARAVDEHGYRGVNIDFENLRGDERDAYTGLIERFAATLRPHGVWLSTALAPRVPSAHTGSECAAHDYGAHGAFTDFVVVMTDERGSATEPPIPSDPLGVPTTTASLDGMRDVVNDALSEIPAEKVLMGMPLPGCDPTASPRSAEAELALADELGVRGVSYSSLPPEGAGDWSVLGRRFQLRKRSSSQTHAASPS
ncbi:MAG TPA: Mur ligase family protein, partial [Solirubrobacteraceae bacterium]|nr:Mur ligase family protein [Solirubrobacteraceae bacterium]